MVVFPRLALTGGYVLYLCIMSLDAPYEPVSQRCRSCREEGGLVKVACTEWTLVHKDHLEQALLIDGLRGEERAL